MGMCVGSLFRVVSIGYGKQRQMNRIVCAHPIMPASPPFFPVKRLGVRDQEMLEFEFDGCYQKVDMVDAKENDSLDFSGRVFCRHARIRQGNILMRQHN